MNFDNMPELHWFWGYPFALILMASVGGGILLWFRHKGWIGSGDDLPSTKTKKKLPPAL
jgi:hypothetical protein